MVIFHVDFFSVYRCYSGALSQTASGEDFDIISVCVSWSPGADGWDYSFVDFFSSACTMKSLIKIFLNPNTTVYLTLFVHKY